MVDSKLSKAGLDQKLLEGLNGRSNDLFDHPAMKAALYLDPRYRYAIIQNSFQVDEAKEFIIQMKQRLDYCKNRITTNESTTTDINADDEIDIEFNVEDAMNDYFGFSQPELNNKSDFEATIDTFCPPNLGIRESVLAYWNGPHEYDLLRDVANAIYAIPPTETQVERDFSALKFIFSDLRSRLSDKNLEDILCIHLNKEIYLEVNEIEIRNLEESL